MGSRWPSRKRSVYMEAVATTMYSALGIDWSRLKERLQGAFHYIEPFAVEQRIRSQEILHLF